MASAKATTPGGKDTASYPPTDAHTRPQGVRMEFGAQTHPGRIRTNNEDQFLVARLSKSMQVLKTTLPDDRRPHVADQEGYIMVVADGMGGAAAGERASALAVECVEEFILNTLKWFVYPGNKEENTLVGELREGLERADRAVIEEAQADRSLRGMGSTLTMAYSVAENLFIVHAGDTRAYLVHDGAIQQLTRDHTLVQELVSGHVIGAEEARHHRMRNIVTNVIGGPHEGVFAEIRKLEVADRDTLLLCSDGLTEYVKDDEIAATLGGSETPDIACKRLVDLANERGGRDNITVIVARYRVE